MFTPFIKNAIVTVDGVACSDEVESVSATPAITTHDWTPISGKGQQDATVGAWSLAMVVAQDWDTPDSLAHLLHESLGEDVVITFRPKGIDSGTWTVTCAAVPGGIGGAAGVAKSTVTLPCKGKPVWTPKA